MSDDAQKVLADLVERELASIATLLTPVVRVCGPLTCDGPERYQYHADRLARAEQILTAQGMSVWSFVASEKIIFGKGYSHDDIISHFHEPILRSGLIRAAYFLPDWGRSNGARREYELALGLGIEIRNFEEAWFNE